MQICSCLSTFLFTFKLVPVLFNDFSLFFLNAFSIGVNILKVILRTPEMMAVLAVLTGHLADGKQLGSY